MPRSVRVDRITRFKGINQRAGLNTSSPSEAIDCRNVICNNAGFLEKLRLPTKLAAGPISAGNPLFGTGPDTISYYTKSSPLTRQYIANYGTSLYSFDATTLLPTLIETAANDSQTWNWAELNNILFGCNGQRAAKWIGTSLQPWGGNAPINAGTAAWNGTVTLARAANVVTAAFGAPIDFAVGDFITIVTAVDASFVGVFKITAFTDQLHVTWAQTAANSNTAGTWTAWTQSPSYTVAVGGAIRANGVTTLSVIPSSLVTPGLGPDFTAQAAGPQGPFTNVNTRWVRVSITGMADASFNGTFTLVSKQANILKFNQPNVADAVSTGGTVSSTLQPLTSVDYKYSYKNSVTGHETSMSPDTLPAFGTLQSAAHGTVLSFTAVNPPDPQYDTIVWYRTVDAGGDFFKHSENLIATFGLTIFDTYDDTQLNNAIVGSLINNPPPSNGKYTAKFQGRVFIAGMADAPQDIAYSGYERIFVGRPEESFPPNNRLRLATGADDIRAIGVIQQGVIGFSKSDKMYMLRGIIEDITTSAPVQFTAYLEELPWQVGAFSHYSVVSTEYGLIWLSSDRNVRMFNGYSEPNIISANVWPILKSITPGQEANARAAYVNWLDRQWYALCIAVNGVTYNNLVLLFDLLPDPEQNAGIFVLDIGRVDSITTLEDTNGQRILVIGQGGNLMQIRTPSIAVNGLSQGISSTNGSLYAYWRGGYFGNEDPEVNKMYRWGRIVSDQPTGAAMAFIAMARLVDQEQRPFTNPQVKAMLQPVGEKFVVNTRAKRCSIEVDFPIKDVDINLLELDLANIPVGVR